MIRRLFVCPDLMRVPKGKRIMKNRRQFLIDNVSAWFLAPELAKRIEWVANHGEKPYLPKPDKPEYKLYAEYQCEGYYLTWEAPKDGDILNSLTWERYCNYIEVNPKDKKAILDWAEERGLHDPELGEFFKIPSPKDKVDYYFYEDYLEGRWVTCESPSAQAYDYLCGLDLGPSKPGQGDPLGRLDLVQGPHPGSNATYAIAECESTLSCLQHRLLELNEGVEIIVTK